MPDAAPVTRIGHQRQILRQSGALAGQRGALAGRKGLKLRQRSTDRG